MKWFTHNSLSVTDMNRLQGTTIMECLAANRLVISIKSNETMPSNKELGLFDCKGLYYYQKLNDANIEILFLHESDLESVMQNLVQYKLSQ